MANNPHQQRTKKTGKFVADSRNPTATGLYRRQRARLLAAQADAAEAELARLQDGLISRADAVQCWAALTNHIRERLQKIPNEIAASVAAASSPVVTQALLSNAIHSALDDLSRSQFDIADPVRSIGIRQ